MHYLLQRRDEEAFHYVFSLCIYQSRSWYILVIDDKDLLQRKRALNTSENKMFGFKLKIGPFWTKPLKLIPRFVAVHWTYTENEKGDQRKNARKGSIFVSALNHLNKGWSFVTNSIRNEYCQLSEK